MIPLTAFAMTLLVAPAQANSGGPGPGGYYFIDSNEPGGPAYVFEDISATGTLSTVTASDDAYEQVDLPFTFEYFGYGYTSVSFQTNGVLGFEMSTIPYTNDCIPATGYATPYGYGGTMDAFVAVLWDDLNPASGGDMYWEVRGTPGRDQRAIFQWHGVPQYPSSGQAWLQGILWEDGRITMAYDDITFAPSATIGIQFDEYYNFMQYECNAYSMTTPLLIEWTNGAPPPPEDADGDGYVSVEDGGGDCDDEDPAINPGAHDIPGDGIDQDCNGSDAEIIDTGTTDTATTTIPVTGAPTGGPTTEPQIQGKSPCGCAAGSEGTSGGAAALLVLGLIGLRRKEERSR